MAKRVRVLFLCTANCCRSQMAEALLRHRGGERFEVHSAGSHPAGYVHPLVSEAMAALGVPMHEGRSKSWDEFAETRMDVVITLCDSAANEACPVWPGAPLQVHWPLPDPVSIMANKEEVSQFSCRVAERLDGLIQELVRMNWREMSGAARKEALLGLVRSDLSTG